MVIRGYHFDFADDLNAGRLRSAFMAQVDPPDALRTQVKIAPIWNVADQPGRILNLIYFPLTPRLATIFTFEGNSCRLGERLRST